MCPYLIPPKTIGRHGLWPNQTTKVLNRSYKEWTHDGCTHSGLADSPNQTGSVLEWFPPYANLWRNRLAGNCFHVTERSLKKVLVPVGCSTISQFPIKQRLQSRMSMVHFHACGCVGWSLVTRETVRGYPTKNYETRQPRAGRSAVEDDMAMRSPQWATQSNPGPRLDWRKFQPDK
jgi:hypothetical protein